MPDALLIFTFSPVQPFIEEARRTADLFSGSSILVQLARAAAQSIQGVPDSQLIYPALLDEADPNTGKDVPNKIVARLPWEVAREAADGAGAALRHRWRELAGKAARELRRFGPTPDEVWEQIWQRQTERYWEVYWSVARLEDGLGADAYRRAYKDASRALDAAKRTRAFDAAAEHGLKDSLSGRREALHTSAVNAKSYWQDITRHNRAARLLQPEGRERLDALGAVKRFGELASKRFLSTSSVASAGFLAAAKTAAPSALTAYRGTIEALLGASLYSVSNDPAWPYDGDLFYRETLSADRLKDSYALAAPDPGLVQGARQRLKVVRDAVDCSLSPYFAVIVLDGDGMGERVAGCLTEDDPEAAHRRLSERLTEFAATVPALVGEHLGQLVYNGGDDVLLLAPLEQALAIAGTLTERFHELAGSTASAGIAVAHHLGPLDAALAAARQAERRAKAVPGKASVAVHVLKHSGEAMELRSPWRPLATDEDSSITFFPHERDRVAAIPSSDRDLFTSLVTLFRGDAQGQPLAGRFASDLVASAGAFDKVDEPLVAELRRLLARHRNSKHPNSPEPRPWAEKLVAWARALPEGEQTEGLARWVRFARFVARGGEE